MKRFLLGLLLTIGVTLVTASQANAQFYAVSVEASPPAVPAGHYVGTFCNTHGATPAPKPTTDPNVIREQCTESIESSASRTMALDIHYLGYNATLNTITNDVTWTNDKSKHRIAFTAWSCGIDLAQYKTGGNAQGAVDGMAIALKAYNAPVIMRWFHEFNLCLNNFSTGCSYNGDSANCFGNYLGNTSQEQVEFISAWKFIYSEFKRMGATNVAFAWCPSNTNWANMVGFYPGNGYVDWNCVDIYDKTNNGFQPLMDGYYNTFCVSPYTAPCIIAETGELACNTSGASYTQQNYIQQIQSLTTSNYPNLKGVAWFSSNVIRNNFDWRFDSCGGLSQWATLSNSTGWTDMGW